MSGKAALIGATGFVGSYLRSTGGYTHFYNSTNIADIRNEHFDVIVCAGTSAVKWRANAEPEQDRAGVEKLRTALEQTRADQFFLISTVDVFLNPQKVDETTPVTLEGLHPYGRHRYELENFVREKFSRASVLRLPTIYGPGLKKNPLYDLLHRHRTDQIPRDAAFQWYHLHRLPQDLHRAVEIPLLHLATEPIPMHTILTRLFPDQPEAGKSGPAASYDMRTIHAQKFGGTGHYIADAETVLSELTAFVKDSRAALAS